MMREQFNDPFAWAIVGYAAAVRGDSAGENQFGLSVEAKFVNLTPQFPWPWYAEEAGWFVPMTGPTATYYDDVVSHS